MTFPRHDSEQGFTMIELLVATAMMVIVCGAAVTMLISVMKQQGGDSERADQIGTARNAIEKLTADIRQGERATLFGTSGVTLTTYCDSGGAASKCQVTYACASEPSVTPVTPTRYQCTRKVGSETARIALTGLASSEIFSGDGRSEPRYVGVKVQLPTPGEEGLTVLEDGAALHNSPSYRGT